MGGGVGGGDVGGKGGGEVAAGRGGEVRRRVWWRGPLVVGPADRLPVGPTDRRRERRGVGVCGGVGFPGSCAVLCGVREVAAKGVRGGYHAWRAVGCGGVWGGWLRLTEAMRMAPPVRNGLVGPPCIGGAKQAGQAGGQAGEQVNLRASIELAYMFICLHGCRRARLGQAGGRAHAACARSPWESGGGGVWGGQGRDSEHVTDVCVMRARDECL